MCNIMYETSCQSRFKARYWMLGAGALRRPRGMVWGGGEEGGRFRMGNTCIPVADSFWYMAKPIQYCKFKKWNKIKKVWPFLLLENSRPLSPWGPSDFLLTFLGIDSLRIICHDLSFWMLSFKPAFSLSSFTFIKRIFSVLHFLQFFTSSLTHNRGGVICISEVIDVSLSNLDFSSCFIQSSVSHDVLCI